jgi:hypothetical protein
MARWLILRRELALNALDAIKQLYPDKMAEVQTIASGDGQMKIENMHLASYTPRFDPQASGLQAQYTHQEVELELHAVCDYQNRVLAKPFIAICEALEDFCARTDLKTHLTSAEADGIKVSQVTPSTGTEIIEDQKFTVVYTLRCMVRSKVTGE